MSALMNFSFILWGHEHLVGVGMSRYVNGIATIERPSYEFLSSQLSMDYAVGKLRSDFDLIGIRQS